MKLIGRQDETTEMWHLLQRKSVVLSSLRRMGKTSLLKIMADNPPESTRKAVFHVVQGNTNVEEFVQLLFQKLVEEGLIDGKINAVRKFYDKFFASRKIGEYELPDLSRHWKDVLTAMLHELADRKNLHLVIMLDEFPWMIYNLATKHKAEKEAMELLDVLRTIRQQTEDKSNLRFVFCGSIGFHIAINHLVRQHQYLGNPTNDMHTFLLYEMSNPDAIALCTELGQLHQVADQDELYAHIAQKVERLPFFIDLVFTELSKKPAAANIERADKAIQDIVQDLSGNGHFDHFKERIEVYYGQAHQQIAHLLLSHLCAEDTPQTRPQLRQAVLLKMDAEQTKIDEVIKDLTTDFYLILNENGQYAFRYALLRRWWTIHYG
jgi:hypothetical protein